MSYLSPFVPSFLDTHADSRSLSHKDASFTSFLRTLWKSDWGESRDATPFDATFEASDMREANREGVPHPGTYYRSYVACMVNQILQIPYIFSMINRFLQTEPESARRGFHLPSIKHILWVPPLYILSRLMGLFDLSSLKPSPSSMSGDASFSKTAWHMRGHEAFWANDGVVPVFSQWHPLHCS